MSVGTPPLSGTLIKGQADGSTGLDLAPLLAASGRPEPFAPGQQPFWDDPHIAQSMLKAHLDPTNDAASRRPETIDRIVDWLVRKLALAPGTRVVDLGCGPGLYAERLARKGLRVTGVDFSRNSIRHAEASAAASGLGIEYLLQDYRQLSLDRRFDLALLIYYDLGALTPADQELVLDRVHAVLNPGGRFAFDVLTRDGRTGSQRTPGWVASPGGFYRPGPHLVLTSVYDYPDQHVGLDQYVVIEADGRYAIYRVWTSYYDLAQVESLLGRHGFVLEEAWADLQGTRGGQGDQGIAVIARRV